MQTWKRECTRVSAAASMLLVISCGLDANQAPVSTYRPVPQGPVSYQPQAATNAAKPATATTKTPAKPKASAKPATSTTSKPLAKPAATSSAAPTGNRLEQILNGVRQAWNTSQTLTAHTSTTDFDGTRYQVSTAADAELAKPNRMWARVTNAADADTVGTELTWQGGESVQVLTKVLGISTTVTLPINDKRLTGIWEWTVADTSIQRLVDNLLAPNAPVTYLGQARLGDQTVDLIEVKSSLVPKANRERLGIDPQQALPVLREIYRNSELMSRSQYSNLRPNAPASHL